VSDDRHVTNPRSATAGDPHAAARDTLRPVLDLEASCPALRFFRFLDGHALCHVDLVHDARQNVEAVLLVGYFHPDAEIKAYIDGLPIDDKGLWAAKDPALA
jgi:hypothetical protein